MEIKSQTNTFEGGMDMDTDVAYMSNNTYRYAENVRLVTDTNGTNGILQNIQYIKEYIELEQLKDQTILYAIAAQVPNDEGELQNSAIVLTQDNKEKSHNHLYIVSNFNRQDISCKCILKILWRITKDDDISMIYNYETSSVYKLYINTFSKGLNILNLNDLRDEWGDKPIEENPVKYSTQIDVVMPKLEFLGFVSGSLPAGTYQYYYKLYTDTGVITTLSAGSELIYNAKANIKSYSESEGYVEGYTTQNGISLSVDLNNTSFTRYQVFRVKWVNNNDLPSIELFSEGKLSLGNIKLQITDGTGNVISIVTQEEFNDVIPFLFNAKTAYQFGNRLFFSNITSNSWDIPESYDCRAFRANINKDVNLRKSNGDADSFNLDQIVQGIQKVDKEHDAINPMNDQLLYPIYRSTEEYAYDTTGQYGGEGVNISYKIIYTETYEGHSGSESMSATQAVYGVNVNGPNANTPSSSNIPVYTLTGNNNIDTLDLHSNQLLSFCNPVISTKLASYQRDEIYRFGIIFYNSFGVSSPVHWIGDIRFPSGDTAGCESFYIGHNKNNDLIARPLGLRFTIKNFPEGAVAAEIVRCDRTSADRTVRAQGMLNNTVSFYKADFGVDVDRYEPADSVGANDVRPQFVPTITSEVQNPADYYARRYDGAIKYDVSQPSGTYWYSVYDIKTFASPELSVNPDSETIQPGDYIIPIYLATAAIAQDHPVNTEYLYYAYGSGVTCQEGILQYDNKYDNDRRTFGRYPLIANKDGILGAIDNQSSSSFLQVIKYYDLESASNVLKNSKNVDKNSQIYEGLAFYYFYSQIDQFKMARRDIPFNGDYSSSTEWGYWRAIKGNYIDTIGGKSFTNTPVMRNKIGVGGITGLINLEVDGNQILYNGYVDWKTHNPVCTLICNIKRTVNPYGGNSYYSRSANTYISCGAFVKQGDQNVIVYGGDTFLTNFCYQHCGMVTSNDWTTNHGKNAYHNAVFVNLPVESIINTSLRSDEIPTKKFDVKDLTPAYYHTQPGAINSVSQAVAMYQYNSTYSVSSGGVNYASTSTNDNITNTENNRYQIVCTEAKSAGEVLDSWAVSKFANTLDMDAKYGQITKLIDFRDRLYVLQQNALSVLSINERALISDNSGSALVLGQGGILDRYDIIVQNYGTNVINDRSAVSTFQSIYWYDNNKNVICSYGNDGFHILSKEKKVQTFLNNIAQVNQVDAISTVNDKQNEVWMKFKGKLLVYNEHSNQFTSFYTHNPDWGLRFYDRLVTVQNKRFYYTNTFGEEDVVKKLTSKITFVVNQDQQYTKVFDNQWFSGNIEDPNDDKPQVLSNINFNTKTQDSFTIHYNDVECREDTYRFPIPRQDRGDIGTGDEENQNVINRSYQPRMRGKYLLCNYELNCDEDRQFEIPFIKTTYRYSML